MAVDTHVFRVSHRLGLSDALNVDKTEDDLVKKLKGRSSRKLQQEFPELKKKYLGRHF